MLSDSSRANLSLLDRGFLLSVVLGPAAAYSIVYLFHLILGAKLSRSVLYLMAGRAFSISSAVRWDIAFFCFFVGWYGLSILWAQNTAYALRYTAYVVLACMTVFYTARICDTGPHLRAAGRFLAIAFSIQIFLAVLEGLRIIRLPFSAFSPYQVYFGRQPQAVENLDPDVAAYVLSMPTGFFGNPNNLSVFLVVILPFFLINKLWSIKLIGSLSILFIVYMTGARAALIAYAVVVLFSVILYGNSLLRVAAILIGLAVGGLGGGIVDAMKDSEIPRVAEVGAIGVAVKDMLAGLLDGREMTRGSVGARAQLILNGLEALRESYGLGVGAGGSVTVQERSPNQPGNLTSMHNFWIELLVDGGVAFALLFATWYISLLWRLYRIGARSTDPMLRYIAQALLLGFIGFVFGAIGPSSVIYMLPMWMLVGIALAVIRLYGWERTARPNPTALPAAPVPSGFHPGLARTA